MACRSHCIYGHYIYADDIQDLHAYGNAGDSCHPPLLWKRGGGHRRHGYIFRVPVLYNGKYNRIGSRYESDLRNELEAGIPYYDCDYPGMLFHERGLFQGGKADYSVYPWNDCLFLCHTGCHRRAGVGRTWKRADSLDGCGRQPHDSTGVHKYQCSHHRRYLWNVSRR